MEDTDLYISSVKNIRERGGVSNPLESFDLRSTRRRKDIYSEQSYATTGSSTRERNIQLANWWIDLSYHKSAISALQKYFYI